VNVTRAARHRLEAMVLDRNAPQKHVWRANIVLATADGCGTAEIMRWSGKARFMAEGVEGLTRDKTRTPERPLSTDTVQRVVDLALRFLNTIEERVPVGKVIYAIVDNYATHKHPKVRQCLRRASEGSTLRYGNASISSAP
jgi:hypothetical protein